MIALQAVGAPPGPGEPRGLTQAEAAQALREAGPNTLAPERRWARARELLSLAADPMALMLVAAGAIYLALGEVRDGVLMLAALVPVFGVDVFLEVRSREALRKLRQAVSPRARVIRDGRELEVPSEALVPGDLLLLREGDVLPADGDLCAAANLAVDEAALTGEAEPCSKQPRGPGAQGDEARFFAGSMVLAGQGRGLITQTGLRTRYGAIAALVAAEAEEPSPLQRKTARLVRALGLGAALVAAAVFALQLHRGQPAGQALLAAIAIAMAAVPEEFPLVFTLFLSLGAYRLSRLGVLVRRLASVETLGATTVICVDKTGTLTRGEFLLDVLVPLGASNERELLETALLACELTPADPIDRAIAARCAADNLVQDELQRRFQLVRDHDFDPVGKHMTHAFHAAGGGVLVAAKGALEGVLEHCELTQAERAVAEARHAQLAAEGTRVLAVAHRAHAGFAAKGATREEDERGWRLVGLLGFRDPVRPEVPAAIAECRAAGIAVKLITGDHALTARAVAQQAGLDAGEVLTGAQLDALAPGELSAALGRASVLARVRPEQKHAIVGALRAAGNIVAMTGDGINDAPALRRADIGVSLGIRGTQVARAAADLVLLNDDFTALVATVREGRRIFGNLQRSFLYLIGFHVPIVGLALLPPLLGAPLLLLPVHLVWLELIVHPISALVFEGEPAPPDVMQRRPRDPQAPLLPRAAVARSVICGALITLFALALFLRLLPQGEAHARAVALAALIEGSLLLVFAERKFDARTAELLPRTRRFWLIWSAAALTLPLATQVPALAQALRLGSLDARDLLLATLAAVAAVGWRAVHLRTPALAPT